MSYDVMEPIGCRFCDADFDCMTDLWQHFLRRHADKHDIVMRPTRDTPPAVPVAPEAAPEPSRKCPERRSGKDRRVNHVKSAIIEADAVGDRRTADRRKGK